jgi:prepilin-type N-terminal cleavage/methylation domain-containing protein
MKSFRRAFSLIEVLAAVSIIGIIVFLALPNVIQAKKDTEEQMVITRAESLNISISAYITANGRSNAGTAWTTAAAAADPDVAKYNLVKPYLSYAPTALADYRPNGYKFVFGTLEAKVGVYKTDTGTDVAVAY